MVFSYWYGGARDRGGARQCLVFGAVSEIEISKYFFYFLKKRISWNIKMTLYVLPRKILEVALIQDPITIEPHEQDNPMKFK